MMGLGVHDHDCVAGGRDAILGEVEAYVGLVSSQRKES